MSSFDSASTSDDLSEGVFKLPARFTGLAVSLSVGTLLFGIVTGVAVRRRRKHYPMDGRSTSLVLALVVSKGCRRRVERLINSNL